MAVYKLFAEKDSTVYSENYTMNTGLDAILELSKTGSLLSPSSSSATRAMIKFSDSDISSVFTNYIGTASFSAVLKLYLSQADGIPTNYSIVVNAISESWDMGTGRFDNIPKTIDGVCWKYRSSNNTNPWSSASFAPGVTGSFVSGSVGGGNWYTGSAYTQSFGPYTTKDINIPVTNIISSYVSGSIVNNGFIIRNSGSIEFDKNYTYHLTYFSRDTNTIYPPVLELKWNDFSFVTGSGYRLPSSSDINVNITNNKFFYYEESIERFRISVREKYPVRTFSTSSIFTTNNFLPQSSYYSIRDLKTNDVIIDFDDVYTKISTDATSNYFDVYMNGLQTSRHYKILIKTTINGSTQIFDNDFIFKIS